MKVGYSKRFEKAVRKLSGKTLDSVRQVIMEVKEARQISDITDCKKLVGYENIYRIRIGDYRAFFTYHIRIVDDTVFFEYIVSRGEAYDKKMQTKFKRIDK
jgi:mRNA interferase RelE/StbE